MQHPTPFKCIQTHSNSPLQVLSAHKDKRLLYLGWPVALEPPAEKPPSIGAPHVFSGLNENLKNPRQAALLLGHACYA